MTRLHLYLAVVCVVALFIYIYYHIIIKNDSYINIWYKLRYLDKNFNCTHISKLAGKQYAEKLQYLSSELDAYGLHLKTVREANSVRHIGSCMEGHVGKYSEEAYVLWEIAKLDQVKVICETGFNAGHSALIWLLAKSNNKVYSFDIGEHVCSLEMAKYLQKRFPGRLTVTWGNSVTTLPSFHEENPTVRCDLMSVDGGHSPQISQSDMNNFMKMSNRTDNIVLLDNHPDRRYRLNITWEVTKSRGLLQEIFRCNYEPNYPQGFTLGRFINI